MVGRREKRFNIRARLFVGSLPADVEEEWLRELFKPHSEVSEVFLHKEKGFGFVRCETRASALKAKTELDNSLQKGKNIRVKFSTVQSYVKVTNLPPFVSVELLESAFSQFGEIEHCRVISDEKSNPKGYGFVLFGKRTVAENCVNACHQGAFLLTRLPMSVNVQLVPTEDDLDDVFEDSIKKTKEYYRDREVPPRFAMPQTFDHELALRWKALDEIERKQKEELESEMRAARIKLMDEMMKALEEQEEMLRKTELMRREEEWRKNDELHKLHEIRKMEEQRRLDEHRKLEELAKQEEMKRRQIDWEIAQREKAIREGLGGGPPPLQPPPLALKPPPHMQPPHSNMFPDQKGPGYSDMNPGNGPGMMPPIGPPGGMPPNSMHSGHGPMPPHGHGSMPPHGHGPVGMPPGMPPHGPPHGPGGMPPHGPGGFSPGPGGMPPHGPGGFSPGPGGMPPHGMGGMRPVGPHFPSPMHHGMPPHPGIMGPGNHDMDRRDQLGPIRPGMEMRRMPPKFMDREHDKRRRH